MPDETQTQADTAPTAPITKRPKTLVRWHRKPIRFLKISFLVLVWVLAALAAWFSYAAVREILDEVGFLPHSRKVVIQFRRDWMVGEFRDCSSNDSSGELRLSCAPADENKAQFMVRFWGPPSDPRRWSCERKEGSFVCTMN